MTKKARQVFTCTGCGHSEPKWLGRCPGCGQWSTMEEETVALPASADRARRTPGAGGRPVPLMEVGTDDAPRRPTGIAELDRCPGP
jgi:DNA repair protein RadA/Sms